MPAPLDTPVTPLPLPRDAGIGPVILFGGSFDPPHRAHAALPAVVRAAVPGCAGACILYTPAARSPHKHQGPQATDGQRLEMLELAIRGVPHAAVWTDELDRAVAGQPSYTIDTVVRARRWLDAHGAPGVPLRLLIGADQAAQFHRWKAPREIIAAAEPLVMLRAPSQTPRDLLDGLASAEFWSPDELAAWTGRAASIPLDPVSATQVRQLLAGNADQRRRARDLLPSDVWSFIERHGLYRAAHA